MQFADVVTRLEDAFTRELPGVAAQAHLAPIPRRQWPDGFREEQVRHAAGLLLVFPDGSLSELVRRYPSVDRQVRAAVAERLPQHT
jgi:hypothetical protein